MLASLFMLSGPTAISFALYLRTYGGSGLRDFGSESVMRLLALLLLTLHVAVILFLGKAWFCGQCHSRQETVTFLMPGVGYCLAIFPPLFAPVFQGLDDHLNERIIAPIGWVLIAVGGFSTLFIEV